MSVATEFVPEFVPDLDPAFGVPNPRRPERRLYAVPAAPAARPRRVSSAPVRRVGASVAVLNPPADADRPPLRLTRRGVVVLSLLVAVLGAALLWVAASSAPTEAASPAGSANASVVTVEPGDTLWSIAGRVAPDTDPRAEVDTLRQLNHLDGVSLVPGQQLRLR